MTKLKPNPPATRLLGLALAIAASGYAQSYAVRMSRPVPVGQRYSVTASGSKHDRTAVGAREFKKQDSQISFEGQAEVIKVDQHNRPTQINFTISKLTKTENGATSELLKPGSVIIADGSRQPSISLERGAIDEPTREAFAVIHSPHKPDDLGADDIFGSKEPRRIGDTWPVNLELAAESLKTNGIIVPQGGLSGSMSLQSKDVVAGIECLALRGELKADNVKLQEDLPNMTVEKGSLRSTLHGCFPIQESSQSYRESAEVDVEFRLASSDGVKLDITSNTKREAVWIAKQK